jgi:hypothetical protein
MLHRAGFARDLAAQRAHLITGGSGVGHFHGNMAVAVAQFIAGGVPVMGELNHRVVSLVAVTNKSQGETAFWVVGAAQQAHTQHFGVKTQRGIQIANAQHGVQ